MDINLLTAKQQLLNDSINEGDESSVISSLSDVSSVSKRSKWIGKHGRGNCLNCTRSRRNRQNSHRPDSDNNLVATRKCKSNQSSSMLLSDISFNSPESILSEESMPDRLTANILYNVQRLSNPVSCKQSKSALLELKQKHPTSFQDICLYSEVCKSLGRSTYRLNARRFIQELFLDLNFESFYAEPTEIISRKERELGNVPKSESETNKAFDLSLSHASAAHNTQSNLKDILNSSSQVTSLVPLKVTSLTSPATASTATFINTFPALKSHIKSPPLESVYETSCENLLMDLIQNSKTSPNYNNGIFTTTNLQQPQSNTFIVTTSPPTTTSGATATISSSLSATNITNLTSNSSNSSSSYNSCNNSNSLINKSCTNQQTADNLGYDEDSHLLHNFHTQQHRQVNHVSSNINTFNAHPFANNNSSNESHYPRFNFKNENLKYTRGRFYTLELDLSCTKNKFPITDRRKDKNTTVLTSDSLKTSYKPTTLLTRAMSVDATDAVMMSETVSSLVSKTTTTTPSSKSPTEPMMTITKSLASSLAKPVGSLYCEKRLQLSKSEAVLCIDTKQK